MNIKKKCAVIFVYLGLLFQLQDVYCRMYILQDVYLSECIFLKDFAGFIFCRMYILQDIYLQDVYIFFKSSFQIISESNSSYLSHD